MVVPAFVIALVAAVGAGATTTGVHTYSTAATQGLPFETVRCSFEVPAAPASFTSQSIFPWCDVQQTTGVTPTGDSSFGVLQPEPDRSGTTTPAPALTLVPRLTG